MPFSIRKEDFKAAESVKVSQAATDHCVATLVQGFQECSALAGVSRLVTDKMDEQEGGFWLCNIRSKDVENGLIKSEYKGVVLEFKREGMEYQVQVCQTKR